MPLNPPPDLLWALNSPQQMCLAEYGGANSDLYPLASEEIRTFFTAVDAEQQFAHFMQQHPQTRLGLRFENLWLFWLSISQHYRCLAHNVQLHQHGKTLGATDFIVQDLATNTIEHWELTLKFYLGRPGGNSADDWIGPNQIDSFGRKLRHLQRQQFPLLTTTAGRQWLQQNRWQIQRQRLISKGRLFYPLLNQAAQAPAQSYAAHLRGGWIWQAQLSELKSSEFFWINRSHWLTPTSASPLAQPPFQLQTPQQAYATIKGNSPIVLFVLPNDWAWPTAV